MECRLGDAVLAFFRSESESELEAEEEEEEGRRGSILTRRNGEIEGWKGGGWTACSTVTG